MAHPVHETPDALYLSRSRIVGTSSAGHVGEHFGPISFTPRRHKQVSHDHLYPPPCAQLIMDGNARWASRRGLATQFGHQAGLQAFKSAVNNCDDWGIQALTVKRWGWEGERRGGGMQRITDLR